MIGLIAALAMALSPRADEIGLRLRDSASAAERLQGPLDGVWTLRDARGRPLILLQFTDPAGGGPLEAAWREPDPDGAVGLVEAIGREREGLSISFHRPGEASVSFLRLKPYRAGFWRGRLTERGQASFVTLRRGG